MARLEYITYLFLLTVSSVLSIPSSYLSSMTGGESGVTWMGWAPQTGMTAIASSGNPWSSWDRGWKNTGVELQPPPKDDTHQRENAEEELEPPKKWNDNAKDNDDEKSGSRSKAEASLNAWFPIMLGLFPPQGENNRNGQSEQPSWDNAKSITAVANSVNHGSRGVASSHAVAYGGQPPNFRSKTWNRDLTPQSNGKTPITPSQETYDVPSNGQPSNGQPSTNQQHYYKPLKRYSAGYK